MQIFLDPCCAAVDGNVFPHASNKYGYFVYKKDGFAVSVDRARDHALPTELYP